MRFKTHAEIFQALLNGEKIKSAEWDGVDFIYLNGGVLSWDDGSRADITLYRPKDWQIYEEPKKKRKLWKWRLENRRNIWDECSFLDEEGRNKLGRLDYVGLWDNFKKTKISEPIEVDEIPQR